jgi:uncharacterized protein (TIGR02147 family)
MAKKPMIPSVMSHIEVKNYTSYRSFLLAYVHTSKQRRPNWTFGVFAKQLGLKDTSSITKIIRGARDPGPVITNRLIEHFKFTDEDAEYFRNLVRLEKIKDDPKLSALLMDRMGTDFPTETRILDEETFEVISRWHCFAIREMVHLKDFVEDPQWISEKLKFKISPEEVTRAIELLVSVELLTRNHGKLEIKEGRFHTRAEVPNEAIKQYHECTIDLAKASVRETELSRREMTSIVFTMNEAKIPEAKELIREFKVKFEKLFEEPNGGDTTVQFQMQLFPLTRDSKGN